MSVRRGGKVPEIDEYDNLRRDLIKVELASFEDEHNGSGSHFWSPGQEIDVVDERGQASELVAIDVLTNRCRFRAEGIDILDDVSWVDQRFELSTSPSMENLPGVSSEQKGPTGQGSDIVAGDGPSMELEQWDDTEVIKTWFNTSAMWPDDDANGGVGGGDWEHGETGLTHFRKEYGRGPVFDRQDSLWMHCMLQGIAAANMQWQGSFEAILYFNDFEIDSPY